MELFLNTYGTYLHVKDQMFSIKVPDEEGNKETHHIAAQKLKTIIMTTSASVSTDAIQLAVKNNVDLIFSDKYGDPIGRVWHSKLGSTTKIRKHQLEASMNEFGVYWVTYWLSRKLQNQVNYLKKLKKHRKNQRPYLDRNVEKIQELLKSIHECSDATSVDGIAEQLRGLEGTAGRIYFKILSELLAEEYQFSGRSYRPAEDAFNAFLNYSYGVLYSKVEKALIIAGLDPYVGFLHRDDYNYKSLVYDFIEPYRNWADQTVFQLFSAKRVNQSHCNDIANGCTLNKEGKVLLLGNLSTYIEEDKMRYRGRNVTRTTAIQLDAHELAQHLLNKKIPEI